MRFDETVSVAVYLTCTITHCRDTNKCLRIQLSKTITTQTRYRKCSINLQCRSYPSDCSCCTADDRYIHHIIKRSRLRDHPHINLPVTLAATRPELLPTGFTRADKRLARDTLNCNATPCAMSRSHLIVVKQGVNEVLSLPFNF